MSIPYNLRHRNVVPYVDPPNNPELFGDDASDSEEDIVTEEIHDSDFEGSTDSEYDDIEMENATENVRLLESRARGRPTSVLRGKNGFKWRTKLESRQSDRIATPERVIIPGCMHEASNANKIEEFWELLFDNEMMTIIVDCTNVYIEEVCLEMIRSDKELQSYHHHTDVNEIKAFIGILYYSGKWKSSHVDTTDLWDKRNGTTFYRCVMSRSRFNFIGNCLRFDIKASRDPNDRLAPIRKLWDRFIGNCSRYYKPSKYCTVDEQLLSFRGKCKFRMFIKSKPDRYGLKIITLNDARTSYLINGIPYLGKTGNGPTKTAEDFFREVTTPIHGTKRSVTCDNWFTSVPLLMNMMESPYDLEITGTIRKNKKKSQLNFWSPTKIHRHRSLRLHRNWRWYPTARKKVRSSCWLLRIFDLLKLWTENLILLHIIILQKAGQIHLTSYVIPTRQQEEPRGGQCVFFWNPRSSHCKCTHITQLLRKKPWQRK